MKVIKFGGTSVGESNGIEQVCYILRDKKKQKDRYAIIISAIGGITDQLINCTKYAEKKNEKYHLILDGIEIKHLNIIQELFTILHQNRLISRIIKYLNKLELFYDSIKNVKYFSKISLDKIMNFGELISSFLINEKLKESGFNSIWKDSRELIVTDNQYEIEQVNFNKSIYNIKSYIIKENTPYIILPGFIASSEKIETVTLGRGGSDYSASIFSYAIQTELLEIWSDVSGIMTGPPKIVLKSFPIEKIPYLEAIEYSRLGAKVIYPPTIFPSMKKNIPIMIRNTFSPLEMGTIIFSFFKGKNKVTGITGMQNITFITLEPVALFTSSDNLIKKSNIKLYLEKQILKKFTHDISLPISVNKELCIISVIVNNMKNVSMTSGHMFSAFGKESIKLHVIFTTEKNISAVIEKKDLKKSMNILHDIFFERPYKKIHIFIAGLGKVGSKLIEQLHKQKDYIVEELHIQIRVIAICNSKRMFFNIKGINLNKWQDSIKLGTFMTIEKFIGKLCCLKLRNLIFIDNTACKAVANLYLNILGKRIGIVTCNKIACASFYHEYKNIKNIAKYFKAPFFFETNVGAGLPIINTLNHLVKSGDKINYINAVLSGSLNFILKKSKGYLTDIILEAKKSGVTEPDPRIDLSGIDVIRKILILIRECGKEIELEDIKQISLLPKSCIKAYTVENFYQELFFKEEFFTQLNTIAKEQRKSISFFAKYKYGEVSVGLENIDFSSPFSQLKNKDNLILYTTELYADQPLIVKGAGAGADVTAAGVFSDIIKASISI